MITELPCNPTVNLINEKINALIRVVNALQSKEAQPQTTNSAMDEICAHYKQFEDCVFFPGDVSCGDKACNVKPRRLRHAEDVGVKFCVAQQGSKM